MDNEKISRSLIGAAGVHYVASELSRRGMIALPTTRNTRGYDIIVASADGSKHANIQVKTTLNKNAQFWPCDQPDKVHSGRHDFYVVVRWAGAGFEGFMVTGKEAQAAVNNAKDRAKSHGKGIVMGNLCLKDLNAKKCKNRWERWKLD